MKDTIHYQVGQKIGDFTIDSYDNNEGRYVLKCKCGSTSIGASDHITRKISLLLSEGYTACQSCTFKYQEELKSKRISNDISYTYKDVFREYVKKAKARDIDFELDLSDATKLFEMPCHYCKVKPSNSRTRVNGTTVFYQGLDRVDNSKGYILSNVVPCCKYCNAAKLDLSEQSFLEHITRIYFNKVQRSASQEA